MNYSLLLISSFFMFSTAQANRAVDIPIDTSLVLSLTNPSSVTVTYNVSCKESNGSASLNLTGQTLAAGTSIVHGFASQGDCVGEEFESTSGLTNGMVLCDYSMIGINFTTVNGGGKCATGSHVCDMAEYNANGMTGSGWLTLPSGVTTWSTSTDNGMTWTDRTGVGTVAPGGNTGMAGVDLCNSGSQGMGSTTVDGCIGNAVGASLFGGHFCCVDAGPAAYCKVEVDTGATSADGYLTSPQFMGGKAF